jgi:hypothetical protein
MDTSRRYRLPAVLLAAGACVSLTAAAQVRYRPTETGPWRPWSFTAVAATRQQRSATAAEVQAFEARLLQLAAIVKRAPAVSPPIGFAGEMWGNLNSYSTLEAGRPAGKAVPLAGALTFGAFPLIEFERGGRKVNEDLKGGETELLQFVVNELTISMGTSRPGGWGSSQIDAFVEPAGGEPVAGLARVGDMFIVKNNPKPLWVPLPLADALQPVLDDRRAQYEQRRDNYARQVAEFTDWQTPEKRAKRRADWQKSAATMPNGAAFVAMMEKTDTQLEAQNRTQLAPGGPEEKGVREAERDFKEAEGIVAALTSETRRAPACYNDRASQLAERFRRKDGAPAACRALVKPNWDYFDPALPRSAPQVVMIAAFTRCLTKDSMAATTPRGGCVINRALVDSLDWNAVRGWLDR